MDRCSWRQVNIAFPDWAGAEQCAVAHLAPLLTETEADQLIASWFFVRKAPCWRVRYLPRSGAAQATAYIHHRLEELKRRRRIADATEIVYEPESHAFGGLHGMVCAHRFFHLDSRHALAHLAHTVRLQGTGHRRELSILLCTALLRSAGLDWYEQGDVWAQIAEHRDLLGPFPAAKIRALEPNVRRLMSVDTTCLMGNGACPALGRGWVEAYATAGRELADLAAHGRLHRGFRAILAHHIVFAWNRLGLSYTTQAVLAHTAKSTVFGQDPAPSSNADHQRGMAENHG